MEEEEVEEEEAEVLFFEALDDGRGSGVTGSETTGKRRESRK